VFVRELLSNSQDALEKMRLLSLTDPAQLDGAEHLNVTVIADPDHNRIVIRGEPEAPAPSLGMCLKLTITWGGYPQTLDLE